MNTGKDMEVLHGSDLRMPSGLEVESATFHMPPTIPMDSSHQLPAANHSNLKHTIDDLKTRATEKLGTLQRTAVERGTELKAQVVDRSTALKTQLADRSDVLKRQMSEKMAVTKVQVRTGVNDTMNDMQHSMRENPIKWAGIAAGSGMALGLLGRFMQWRASRRTPDLIVIRACS